MRARSLLAMMVMAAAVVAGAASITYESPARAAASTPEQRTGDVIVKFKDGASLAAVGAALDGANASATASSAPSGFVLLEPEPGQSVDAAVAALRARNDVAFAEPDLVVTIDATPNDTYYAAQWHYPQINLPQAWDITTGSSTVIVAVLDTGVMLTHPDLDGKITSGANAGYDFVNSDTNPTDDHGHGTFVSGIIAAESNNAAWVAGVCWACKIMPVKVLSNTGNGSTFNVAAGVDWARTHGASVVNLSLGSLTPSATLETAVNNAYNAGIVVVGASGNYANDADPNNDTVMYPGAYPNAIGVGANDSAGARSAFSNFGPELDVMAPGENVLSTVNGGGYGSGSGTSFATPHVAGLVGLMYSAGITSPATIYTKLTTTATDMGTAGFDNLNGFGRVNAQLAVQTTPTYGISWGADNAGASMAGGGNTSVTVSFTNIGSLTWASGGANPVRFAYHWKNGACPGTTTAVWNGLRTNLPADVAGGGAVTNLNTTIAVPATPGTYCLQFDLVREGLTWFSSQGAATKSKTVTVTVPTYGVSWGADNAPSTMIPSSSNSVAVTITNTGALTWNASGANPVRFAYHWLNGACNGSSYLIYNGVRTNLPSDLATGGTVTNLNTTILAPPAPGTYCLQFDMVREGIVWFGSQGAATKYKTVTVSQPVYGVSWGADDAPATMTASSTNPVTLSFTNTGSLTWSASGANPVRLSYHWKNASCSGSTAVWDGVRTALAADVPTSGTVTGLNATVIAPAAPGTYCLVFDLVREGLTWFSTQGASTNTQIVTIN